MPSLARSTLGRPTTLAGTLLIVAGIVFLGYAIGAYLDVVPGSKIVVPTPVALGRPRPTMTTTPVRSATPTARPTIAVATRPPVIVQGRTPRTITGGMLAPPLPSVFRTPMVPADADDRPYWSGRPRPGLAARLAIPAIQLDTEVVEGGIVTNERGEPEWQTVPFVAIQYRELGRVGARGNAVISGHVVTVNEGNVFRDLHKLDFGDSVQVQTDQGAFTYLIEDIMLVKPDQTEVMQPTKDHRLTLITCGGEFDSRTRSFSHRLIIVSRLADWQRLPDANPVAASE